MKKRGKAYRRWKTLTKYVSRIKKRLYYMQVQYDEYDTVTPSGVAYKRKLWRSPENWKEADKTDSAGTKLLKKTPTPYTDPWKKISDKKTIKELRENNRRIINDELNELQNK
jgi:hypothetical protein